jgi:hypothetical protein
MTGDQVEYSLVVGFGAFATAVGYGVLDMGLSDARRATLRWSGTLITVMFLARLLATFVR